MFGNHDAGLDGNINCGETDQSAAGILHLIEHKECIRFINRCRDVAFSAALQ